MESKSHIENDDFDKKNFMEKKIFFEEKKNFFFRDMYIWQTWNMWNMDQETLIPTG